MEYTRIHIVQKWQDCGKQDLAQVGVQKKRRTQHLRDINVKLVCYNASERRDQENQDIYIPIEERICADEQNCFCGHLVPHS